MPFFPRLSPKGVAGISVFFVLTVTTLLGSEGTPLDDELNAFGGSPTQWFGPWKIFEPRSGSLQVALQADDELQIAVATQGESTTGRAEEAVALSRAISPETALLSGGRSTFAFSIRFDDTREFLRRGAFLGFTMSDLASTSVLSSRSSWNIIAYGAEMVLGDATLQAGELGLRVRAGPYQEEIITVPSGIFLSDGALITIRLTLESAMSSFSVEIEKDGQIFTRSDLGFWSTRPIESPYFFNAYFTGRPNSPYSLSLSGLDLKSE